MHKDVPQNFIFYAIWNKIFRIQMKSTEGEREGGKKEKKQREQSVCFRIVFTWWGQTGIIFPADRALISLRRTKSSLLSLSLSLSYSPSFSLFGFTELLSFLCNALLFEEHTYFTLLSVQVLFLVAVEWVLYIRYLLVIEVCCCQVFNFFF